MLNPAAWGKPGPRHPGKEGPRATGSGSRSPSPLLPPAPDPRKAGPHAPGEATGQSCATYCPGGSAVFGLRTATSPAAHVNPNDTHPQEPTGGPELAAV